MKERDPRKREMQKRLTEMSRRLAELELRESLEQRVTKGKVWSEKEWHDTFDAVSEFISVHDRQFRFLRVNKAMADFLGLPPEELVGKTCYEMIHGTTKPVAKCPHHRSLVEGRPVTEEFYDPKHDMHLLVSCSPLKDREGKLIGSVHIARDITEEKRIEEAVRQSHDRLVSILDSLEAVVYVADMETYEVLFINRYGREIFGDVLGKRCWETLQRGQKGPCPFCTNQKLLQPEGTPAGTVVWEHQIDLTGRWFECRDKAIPWVDGRMVRLEIATDIMERKVTETQLRERNRIAELEAAIARTVARDEDLHKMLQGCAEALVHHLDAALARIWTFNAKEQVLELQASAGLYTHRDGLHSRIPIGQNKIGKIAERCTPHITQEVVGDPEIHDQEWVRREKIVSFAGYPLVAGNELIGVMAIFGRKPIEEASLKALSSLVDVISVGIARMEAEDSVQAVLAFREAIENSISSGVAALDMTGRILYVNEAFCQMVGWSESELLGYSPPFPYWEPKDQDFQQSILDKVLSGEARPQGRERRFRRKEGEVFPAWVTFAPLHNWEGRVVGWVESVSDISRRKQMEEALLRSRNLESIGTLAAGIAHDFNNLLTSILGNISLAEMSLSPGGEIANLMSVATDSCLKAKELTSKLLTFSKGGGPIRSRLRPASLVREGCRFALAGSKVICKDEGISDCREVEIDEDQIGRVVHNLVMNAREAMPEGGTLTVDMEDVELEAQEIFPLAAGSYVRIRFSDKGRGIPKEDLRKIFDPYYSTKHMGSVKGMGLGLSIAHSIVERHGGTITVDSILGKGSVFTIYLPAVSPEKASPPPDAGKRSEKNISILVMDDDPGVRKTSKEILQKLGYRVTVAAEGEEAVKLYRMNGKERPSFDAVILDLTVPGGKGALWTMKELQRISPSVKAILASGYADDPVLDAYADHGFAGILIKPYRVEVLEKLLNQVLSVGSNGEEEPAEKEV